MRCFSEIVMKVSCTLVVTALCALLGLPSASLAQGGYFGKNKVQYREFDFKVLKTDHFDIYYYPEEEQAAQMASRMAERWYTRLSQLLDHQLSARQPIILYASGSHFRQTNAIEGDLGEGTGGVTEAYKRRVVLPFAGPMRKAITSSATRSCTRSSTTSPAPMSSSGDGRRPRAAAVVHRRYGGVPVDRPRRPAHGDVDARGDAPRAAARRRQARRPEAISRIATARRSGRTSPASTATAPSGNMLRAGAGRDATYAAAIKDVLQIDTKQLSQDWHNAEFEAFRPIAESTKMPASFARPLITKEKQKGDLNIGPKLSPDGSKVIYFSERDLFSIDLFVADARTGEVLKKITNTATSAHYESLSFLTSAGAWDSAGKRFVFPGRARANRC